VSHFSLANFHRPEPVQATYDLCPVVIKIGTCNFNPWTGLVVWDLSD
jgi:hypothetical protein